MRLLQWGDRDRTLADSHADGLTGKPHLISLVLEYSPLPFRRRVEAGLFSGNVDAGQLTIAECTHKLMHVVDAHLLGHPVEIDVAGSRNRSAHIYVMMYF